MKVNSETIIESLKKVIEPDLGKDIVSLGLVTDIKVMENKVSFSVQIKNAAMHARKRMQQACEFAIERSIGKNYSIDSVGLPYMDLLRLSHYTSIITHEPCL